MSNVEMGKDLKTNMIWNSIGSIVYQACIWLINYICVLQVGFEDAGILAIAMSTTNIFFTIAIYGMRAYQSSDVMGKFNDNEYIYSRYFTCFIALALCVLVSVVQYDAKIMLAIIIYMFFRISEAYTDVLHGIDQRFMRMDIIGKSFIFRGIVSIIAFAVVLYITNDLIISLLTMAIFSFVIVLAYDFPKVKNIGDFTKKPKLIHIKKLLIECIPLVIYAFLNTTISNLPRLFLIEIKGEYIGGVFTSIIAPVVIIQLGASYIFTPLISVISVNYNKGNKKEYSNIIKKVNIALGFVGIIGVIGGFLLADLGFTILYSSNKNVFNDVMNNKDLLVPAIVSATITAFVLFYNMVLTIIRDFKGLIVSTLAGLICCLLISYPIINAYNLQGANLSLAISLLVQLIFLIVFEKIKVTSKYST